MEPQAQPVERHLCECGVVLDEDFRDIYGKPHVCPLGWGSEDHFADYDPVEEGAA